MHYVYLCQLLALMFGLFVLKKRKPCKVQWDNKSFFRENSHSQILGKKTCLKNLIENRICVHRTEECERKGAHH